MKKMKQMVACCVAVATVFTCSACNNSGKNSNDGLDSSIDPYGNGSYADPNYTPQPMPEDGAVEEAIVDETTATETTQ